MEFWVMTWTVDGIVQPPKLFGSRVKAQKEFYEWKDDKNADGTSVEWENILAPCNSDVVWWLANDEYDIEFHLTEVE